MSVVKSGYMRKFSKSLLSGGWNQVWVVLHKDTNLIVYKKQGDSSPMGTINMFEVKKWFAYGQHTSHMPERPSPPAGATIEQILAVPQKPSSKAKVHWFLASSEADLHAWMEAICSVLPPPPQKSGSAPIQPQTSQSVSSAPPPYPGGPAPGLGFDGVPGGPPMPVPGPVPYPTQQSAYPQQHHPPPQQPYYQPPAYPQQGGYPQQHHPPPPPVAYPQQGYYPAQGHYQPPPAQYAPPPGAYPQQPGYYAPPPAGAYYPQQGYAQPTTVVYQQSPKRGFLSGNTGKMALGLAGGAAVGYGMSRMMGGGLGMGWGRCGSWSSLSSFGSCGSFGSFGSFD